MEIANQMRLISGAFLDVFYPKICQICQIDLHLNERQLCLSCNYDLPYIGQNKNDLVKLEQLFWGRVKVERVFSLLNYQRGNTAQHILHQLKYHKKKKLGFHFGHVLGGIIDSDKKIDAILPVPLHPKKKRLRGFNQSYEIANGIAQSLHIPVTEKYLKRVAHNASQTKFTKYERWDNVRRIFSVNKGNELVNKHVLLVDDVLTTGATLEACVLELLQIKNCSVSIATLAARI